MDKFCVFCGNTPQVGNSEHIIPRWLIKLTGNPTRKAYFGFHHGEEEDSKRRIFSFGQFQFPSCSSCNQEYSSLEASTQLIITKILASESLSAMDFNILLDWFDKVRIGLWFSFQYLDKNPAGITPKFHIKTRMSVSDRMLAIFRADTDIKGLNYIGCDYPSFIYTPSCFSFRVNGFFFLNMSYNDLFSRRIGFPYPTESFAMPKQQLLISLTGGRNSVIVPLLKKRFTLKCKEIYQPMFRYRTSDSIAGKLYNTQYVRQNAMIWEEGRGKIFIQDDNKLREYPISPSGDYIPCHSYGFQKLALAIGIQTLEWQQYIDSLAPSLKKLPILERTSAKKQQTIVKNHSRRILQALRDRRIIW